MQYIFLLDNLKGKDGTARLSQDIYQHSFEKKLDNIIFSKDLEKYNFSPNSLKCDPFSKFNFLYIIYDLISIFVDLFKKRRLTIKAVICLTENFSLLGYILSKFLFTKNYICCYGTYGQRISVKNKFYYYIFINSYLLASSEYTKKNLIKNIVNKNVDILRLFVSNNFFNLNKSQQINNIKKKQFIFVGGGSFFKRRKGLKYILKILKNDNFRKLELKFLIVGNKDKYPNSTFNDEHNNELKFNFIQLKEKLNYIYPNHQFCGQISELELSKLYSESLFNILLADHNNDEYDGYGLIHLEANACRTYSIGSKSSGALDAIEYGSVFNVNDTEDIVKYIQIIVNQPYIPNFSINKIRKIDNYFEDLHSLINRNERN